MKTNKVKKKYVPDSAYGTEYDFKIRFYYFDYSLKNLQILFDLLKIPYTISEPDEDGIVIFQCTYNYQIVKDKLHRSYGRPKTYLKKNYTVEEIEERIKKETAEIVAIKLGISRSTLFRKLKRAKEYNDKFLY